MAWLLAFPASVVGEALFQTFFQAADRALSALLAGITRWTMDRCTTELRFTVDGVVVMVLRVQFLTVPVEVTFVAAFFTVQHRML